MFATELIFEGFLRGAWTSPVSLKGIILVQSSFVLYLKRGFRRNYRPLWIEIRTLIEPRPAPSRAESSVAVLKASKIMVASSNVEIHPVCEPLKLSFRNGVFPAVLYSVNASRRGHMHCTCR